MRKPVSAIVLSCGLAVLLLGFAELSEGQDGRRRDRGPRGPIADFPLTPLPESVATPSDNPQTAAKVELGRLLCWDPVLSGNRDVACGTCHHPRFGYAENLDISIGVDGRRLGSRRRFVAGSSMPFVKRNSQSILNTAFNGIDPEGRYEPAAAPKFWDLRADGLEAQTLSPLITFEEMRGHALTEDEAVTVIVERLPLGSRENRRHTLLQVIRITGAPGAV